MLFVLVGLAAVFAIGIGVTVGVAVASVRNIETISRSTETESALPTVLIDRNGREITELFGEEKRTLVSIEALPRHLIYALLTREDGAFFEHPGFNLWGMARAAANLALQYVSGNRAGYFSGGSTITQQLAKMMYTDQSVTVARKLKELWWALQLERHFTKYEILEEYLNRMPFGHGTYGVEAASQFYFGHGATDLTVAESVLVVLQLSSPGFLTYSPIANPESARKFQREILGQMVELGFATQEEVDHSFQEYWANHDYTRNPNTAAFLERLASDPAPWFTEHVRQRLQDELLLGSANIYTDGYRVYTTLDLDYQRAAQDRLWTGLQQANETYRRNQATAEERIERFIPMVDLLSLGFDAQNLRVGTQRSEASAALYFQTDLAPMVDILSMMFDSSEQDAMRQVTRQSYLNRQDTSQRSTVEGALITIQNQTGHILAMVGGSPFEARNQNNRAINAMRPPGSSFKPIYYAAALDRNVITTATVFNDSPMAFWNSDGTPYTPRNYIGEWRGPTRVRYALATSMNIVSLQVLQKVGFTDAFATAGRLLGLNETQLAQRGFEPRYPIGLGTVSLSPFLMAKAFATFANGGREVIPISVRYIEDRRGRVILEPEKEVAEALARKGRNAQVISPQTAYLMVDMLQSTVEYGTLANRRRLVGGFDGMPMAGKTGTTQNWSDAWTIGFSPYMTTAVWLGFDRGGNNSLGTNQTGAQAAGPIWAWYMKDIHQNLPPIDFEQPSGLVEVTVTDRTGLLPPESYRGTTITELFKLGTQPVRFDDEEGFHDRRRDTIVQTLTRPTAVRPALSVSGLLSSGFLDTTTSDREPGIDSPFRGRTNPFFDDPLSDGDGPGGGPPVPQTVLPPLTPGPESFDGPDEPVEPARVGPEPVSEPAVPVEGRTDGDDADDGPTDTDEADADEADEADGDESEPNTLLD